MNNKGEYMNYLERFYNKLEKWKGSLIKVDSVKSVEPNAKEYLNKLAKMKKIQKVRWGWYWIPDEIKDIWDFMSKDKNFKVVSAQTAASFWNYDFVHRDIFIIKVGDKSYGKALIEFAKKMGWNIIVEYVKKPSDIKFVKFGNLFVEDLENTIVKCLQNWSFTDAFAALYTNRRKIKLRKLLNKMYWKRISKSNIRIRQVLGYGCYKINELVGKKIFPLKEIKLCDEFVKREVDESIEKVVELG
jgi:hypothetical protein